MDARFKWFLVEVRPGPCTIVRHDEILDHQAQMTATAVVGTMDGRRQEVTIRDCMSFSDGSGEQAVMGLVKLSMINAREAAESYIEAANQALDLAHADALALTRDRPSKPAWQL